jgi:hypothetical protein
MKLRQFRYSNFTRNQIIEKELRKATGLYCNISTPFFSDHALSSIKILRVAYRASGGKGDDLSVSTPVPFGCAGRPTGA